MKMIRPASELEIDYIDANMAIYNRFDVLGKFSSDEIAQALEKLAERHPFLRCFIKENAFYEKKMDIPIHQVSCLEDNEKVFSYVLDPSMSLCKFIFFHNKESTCFLMLLHHAIADGVSSMQVVGDFLEFLYDPALTVEQLPVPLSIEDYFPWKPSFQETEEYAAKHQMKIKAPEMGFATARLNFYKIPFQERFNNQGISTNSLLTALLIKSLTLEGEVCIAAAVDVRKRLDKEIPLHLITAPAGACVFLEVSSSEDLITLAKRYQEALLSHINSPQLLLQHYAILRGQLNMKDFRLGFFLSNAGKTAFSEKIREKITSFSFSGEVVINCPYIACVTHRGEIALTVTYPDPLFSSEYIDKMIQPLICDLIHS